MLDIIIFCSIISGGNVEIISVVFEPFKLMAHSKFSN